MSFEFHLFYESEIGYDWPMRQKRKIKKLDDFDGKK